MPRGRLATRCLTERSVVHACGVCVRYVERAGTRWNAVLLKEASRPGVQETPFVAVVYACGGSVESGSRPRRPAAHRAGGSGGAGLLILQARGNAFIRDLGDGERIYVVPQALVYKDRSVAMNIHMEIPESPRAHWQIIPMIRLTGPGRVAIQSQPGFEGVAHWGWDVLGPDGSWRNWNSDMSQWKSGLKEREPLYP